MDSHISYVPIYSINYDFLPTTMYGAKCLWIDLKFPAPANLAIGERFILVSADKNLIFPGDILTIRDIVGTRLVINRETPKSSDDSLKYFTQKRDDETPWQPLKHAPQWGYSTRDLANPNPAADRNWLYGHGKPIAFLVY